jgi:hypothetical protein
MVGKASASDTSRAYQSLRALFVAELAAALETEPEAFGQTKPGSMMESVVRALVLEAQKGSTSAIRQIFRLLERAERDADPSEPVREVSQTKRTATPTKLSETSSGESARMRKTEQHLRDKLTRLEPGNEPERPDVAGSPVDLETARRVVESLRTQKCDSPDQEELRQRFLRLAEAELEEQERQAVDPATKEHKENKNGNSVPDRYG